MRRLGQQVLAVVTIFSFVVLTFTTARAIDPEMDRLIRGPAGKDWVTNGAGCIFDTFWETPVLMQPSGIGGTNWSPMPYSPDTGYFYVPGTVRTSAFTRFGDKYITGQRYTGGSQSAPIGSPMSGTFTAIDSKTNTIA